MRNFTIAALAIFVSQPAFALHGLDCTSASGSIKFQEEEIWGANPKSCGFFGRAVPGGVLTIENNSIIVLRSESGPTEHDWKKTYVAEARLSSNAGNLPHVEGYPDVAVFRDFVICEEWSSSAVDFAAPSAHCDIHWE